MSTVQLHTVHLTPDLAQQLFALNSPERSAHMDLQLVDCYAQQMRSGEWRFTADSIKINASGALMDGQHRLLACIRSGWSGPQVIAIGVPDDAAYAMDLPGKAPAA